MSSLLFVEHYWINLTSCIQTTAEETIGYKESKNIVLRNLMSQEKSWRRWKKEGNGRISTQKKPKETTGN